jgi:hypothetical protein
MGKMMRRRHWQDPGVQRAILAAVAIFLAGCGGGEEEVAPAGWCRETGTVLYLLDQYSTTHDQDRLSEWEDSSPADVRPDVARMRTVLRRYPVDADAPDLVAARRPVEEFAEDRCEGKWRNTTVG